MIGIYGQGQHPSQSRFSTYHVRLPFVQCVNDWVVARQIFVSPAARRRLLTQVADTWGPACSIKALCCCSFTLVHHLVPLHRVALQKHRRSQQMQPYDCNCGLDPFWRDYCPVHAMNPGSTPQNQYPFTAPQNDTYPFAPFPLQE
jgi:hypothetical protein